jgi:hypothetical protein
VLVSKKVTRPLITLCALGISVAALTTGALATAGDPDALSRHLLLYIGAGAAWALALALIPRLPQTRGQLLAIALVGLATRVPAWTSAAPHSDDVYRYLWDGRVQRSGIDPYAHPPDAPELAALRDDAFQHVNNRDLPTIYPPGAQLLFRLAARSLVTWKLLVAAFDLATFALLLGWLRRGGADPRRALAWWWSPLVVIELGANAHLDGVGAALLAAGLFAWQARARRWGPWLAGALVGAAAAVKLLGAIALPQLRSWRALTGFALAVALVALPFAGSRVAGSLGEYGRRWRANDGAFAVIHAVAARAVAHTRFSRRYTPASPQLARWVTGRDRNQVFPDEAANFAARAAVALLFVGALAWALRTRADALDRTRWLLGVLLLLSPTLHPWYVLWLVPLLSWPGGAPWVALALLVPLGYVPLADWLAGRPWHDPAWTRAVEHGIAWAVLLGGELTLANRRVRSQNP